MAEIKEIDNSIDECIRIARTLKKKFRRTGGVTIFQWMQLAAQIQGNNKLEKIADTIEEESQRISKRLLGTNVTLQEIKVSLIKHPWQ